MNFIDVANISVLLSPSPVITAVLSEESWLSQSRWHLVSEMITYDMKSEFDVFDLSHIIQAATMQKNGRLKSPLYVQFVMGVENAMPADERVMDFYFETLKRHSPDAQWYAAGIGSTQLTINKWSTAKGG